MATVGQIYYNIVDTNSGGYISSGIDIFSDVVAAYGASRFNKVGIQAPPGTKVTFNNSKTIMVGRTGMYELDHDVTITAMKFDHPKRYEKDVETSEQYIQDGTAMITTANTNRTNALKQFYKDNPVIPDREEDPEAYEAYWDAYNAIQATYITEYQAGLALYNQGINGVYVLPYPLVPTDPRNYKDLYNIIIDFIYE